LAEGNHQMRRIGGRSAAQESDDWLGLCVSGERPRRSAAEQGDELAAFHSNVAAVLKALAFGPALINRRCAV
jgi:hypothetical protein